MEPKTSEYRIEYPFQLEKTPFTYFSNCTGETEITKEFPMDFSSSARFYVTTGVLCMLYCTGALAFYVLSASYYATNPLIPVLDLIATAIFTIFWFAGSCAWAAGVSDLKYYTNPGYLKQHLNICKESEDVCQTKKLANWSSLNVSLVRKPGLKISDKIFAFDRRFLASQMSFYGLQVCGSFSKKLIFIRNHLHHQCTFLSNSLSEATVC